MLLSNDNGMIRVLQTQGDRSLIIDCMKRTMPKWVNATFLSDFVECSETNLYDRTGMIQNRELTQEEQRIAQEHFTMIAAVLPFIGNEPKRNEMIDLLSEHQSKQTIRKYLCLYLVYQNLAALAPGKKVERKELSQDEKNMRWALNKFFYTQHKNSLNTAYTIPKIPKHKFEEPKSKIEIQNKRIFDDIVQNTQDHISRSARPAISVVPYLFRKSPFPIIFNILKNHCFILSICRDTFIVRHQYC